MALIDLFFNRFLHRLKTTQKWENLRVDLMEKVLYGFADTFCNIIELETML